MTKNTETEKKEELKVQPKKAKKPNKEKMIKVKESEHAQLAEDAAKYKDQYVELSKNLGVRLPSLPSFPQSSTTRQTFTYTRSSRRTQKDDDDAIL